MEILGGTGRDGCCFFSRRDGAVFVFFRGGTGRSFFFPEAGRGGCCFFPRRDGAVVVFLRGGTGRLYFFFEAGRDGVVVFFRRRDRAVVFFVRTGTGRLTVVVFSAGTVLLIRVRSGGG